MTKKDKSNINTFGILIEALCIAAAPDFGVDIFRNGENYVKALEALIKDNTEAFELCDLKNLYVFIDEIDEENPVVSNIIQLLNGKLEIRTIE